MEIIKIFSNVEDPEENLYSVLMTEDEIALFSEAKEEEEKKSSTGKKIAKGTGLAAGSLAALASAGYGVKKGADYVDSLASKAIRSGKYEINSKELERLAKTHRGAQKVSKSLGKVFDPVENAVKNVIKKRVKK